MMARLGLSMCIAASLVTPVSAATSPAQRQAIEAGRGLAQAHCATCHAIGKRGQSLNPQAPRFATLAQHYPLDNLAEAFSEGILVGHGPMPEFQFEPDQIDSLIAYLRSVQTPIKKGKKRASK
jgi:cytochrome c